MINVKLPGHLPNPAFSPPAPPANEKYWPPVLPPSPPATVDNVVKTISDEAKRRDDIVRKLYNAFPLKPGDTATASNSTISAKIGDKLIIMAVAKGYSDLGKDDKWPEDDNPLMVHVKSYDKDCDFFVTTNAVKRSNAA